ncbi:hypothetical protein BC833DRAFT_589399 [Globomyces pollinis-pini]|nr:hypothetical protein BC833DRAFT_589399 [Globomyces pollinis-pini]
MDRIHALGVTTSLLSLLIISKSFIERRGHFFSTCVQITQSNINLMVLLGMTFYYVILVGKGIQRFWFGQLRALEVEHLYERSWFSIMDTCLALTIFRDGFDLLFVIRFGTLLFSKTFHWIIGDRIDFMEQTPNLTYGFHLRMTSIMALFFMVDIGMLVSAYNNTIETGPTMLIVFGFEYAILASVMIASFAKYVMNTIEINRETPWEERTLYFLYVDLFLDFFKLISYLVFFAVVVNFYGIPLHIVRDVYLTFRSFIKRLYGLLRYREATANMNERYPTPTEDELNATDKVCIVCREEMCLPSVPPAPATPVTEIPKKLPCGHLFHFRCLRSWLERQQTCPTCRGNILETPPPQPAAQNNGPNVNPNANAQPNAPVGGIMGIFRQLQDRGRAAAGLAQVPQQVVGPNIPAVGLPRHPVVPNPQQQELRAPNIPFGMPNGIQPLPNIVYPLTLTPLNSGNPTLPTTSLLSLEQLRGMEGSSRVAAATRLQELRNIRSQLDILCNRMEQVLMLMPNEEEIVLTAGSSLVEPEIDQ